MAIADSSLADVAGSHASKLDTEPARNIESDQVVVLIRLPYLPPAGSHPQNSGTQCSRATGSPEIGTSVPPSSPAVPQASEAVEESESLLPRLLAGFASVVADSRRYLAGVRVSPLIWKTAGFAAAVVLILSALLLLRGGTPSRDSVATRYQGGVPFPIAPLAGEPVHDSAPMPESEPTPSVADETVAKREQPRAESETEVEEKVIEEEAPELEPMATPEVAEVAEVDQEALGEVTPEEVLPLTHPEAGPEPLSSSGSVSAEAARDDSGGTQAQANPNQPDYPVTNPSTYQYPSRYEQLLINALHGFHNESYPSTNPSTSIYGWQPNTVRLQPRIEPPPIR